VRIFHPSVRCFRRMAIPAFLTFSAPLHAGQDASLRLDLNFSHAFNRDFQSVSYLFFQANDGMSNFNYNEWGSGVLVRTRKEWLALLFFFQVGCSKTDNGNWRSEHRPSVSVVLTKKVRRLQLTNQLRYEYLFGPVGYDYRIKNTAGLSLPDLPLQPSLGWEMYYEHRDGAVVLHRFKVGITRKISKHVSIGCYYRMDVAGPVHARALSRQLAGFHLSFRC